MKEETKLDPCFIICPIGAEGSEVRKHADRLLKHVLSPVLDRTGYEAVRADQIAKVGLITVQIINAIIDSPLVIADLTGSNPNVFYELALRHAIRKPYIQIISKGEKIPFDIAAVRTVELDLGDLDSVEKAKTEIENQIKEFKKGHKADSPVSVASMVTILRDNDELINDLAEKISFMGMGGNGYFEGGDDTDALNKIWRKVSCIRDYCRVDFEDLDNKLNMILRRLEKPNQPPEGTR